MSKKASLAKKIAHTLMAMSIVYSSGINIVINEAYAAERTENITSGGTKEFEEKLSMVGTIAVPRSPAVQMLF